MVSTPSVRSTSPTCSGCQFTCAEAEERSQTHVVAVAAAHLVTRSGQAVDLLDCQCRRYSFYARPCAFDGSYRADR
jgi:hypothetical protein